MPHPIATQLAPAAIGPYSQAIVAQGMIFISGQLGLDPATGELVAADTATQTTRIMENLTAILAQAGAELSAVVKTTIYLVDLAEFATVNQIYSTYFSPPYPARATLQVAALPRGARVEIDAIALQPEP